MLFFVCNASQIVKSSSLPYTASSYTPKSGVYFSNQTFGIFLNGWIDIRDAFHAVERFMVAIFSFEAVCTN